MPYRYQFKKIAQSLYNSLSEDPFYKTLERIISDDPLDCKEAMLKYYDYSIIKLINIHHHISIFS